MARILSIDWDYFVEEDPMLDMGHRESALFLTTMWAIRCQLPGTGGFGDLERMLPFRGPEPEEFFADYLGHIKVDGHMQYVCTAESHSALPKWADGNWPNEQLDIINVDAHHDILYGMIDQAQANDQAGFNCGSWAGHLMAGGRVRSYTQVYPAWRKKFPEGIPDELRLWVRKCGVKLKLQDAPWTSCRRRIDGVFLARSGCWVPPIYDAKFDTLCKFFGGGLVMSREEVCRMQREAAVSREGVGCTRRQ